MVSSPTAKRPRFIHERESPSRSDSEETRNSLCWAALGERPRPTDQGRASGETEPWEGVHDARPPAGAGNARISRGPPREILKRARPAGRDTLVAPRPARASPNAFMNNPSETSRLGPIRAASREALKTGAPKKPLAIAIGLRVSEQPCHPDQTPSPQRG